MATRRRWLGWACSGIPSTLCGAAVVSVVVTAALVRASYLAPNRTPVTASRSEDDWWWVLAVSLGASLVGLLVLLGVKTSSLTISTRRLLAVSVIIVGGGVWAGLLSYLGQDVWTFSDNWTALVATAYGAVIASSAAVVFTSRAKQ